jgi:rhamnulokinase
MATSNKAFLAVDLGAESGRGIIGRFIDDRLQLDQIHRFSTAPVKVRHRLLWDVLSIHQEIKNSIAIASQQERKLAGMAIDSWGVDFGLLTAEGDLLGAPHHYRDERTTGMFEVAFRKLPQERIFHLTGIQFLEFNTLYQLLAMIEEGDSTLSIAKCLLMMGELFTYFLTGERVAEFTNATTTQLYNPTQGAWADELLVAMRIPADILPPVVPPGTQVGCLNPLVQSELGVGRLPVYMPAVHDTASAIAAVPLSGPTSCYISSGTWSLMGVETDQPIITPAALAANMTNEGGVAGKFCFLKNIMGMWLLQECRRTWEQKAGSLDYAALQNLAEAATPLVTLINPDHADFFAPGQMPRRIAAYAERTGQPVPADYGAMVRCILDSLALRYKQVLLQLQELTHRQIDTIHIVGGGSQNTLLNQLTADATGCRVVAGPVEATAIGNILVQAMAAGVIDDLAEGRTIIRNSFGIQVYEPQYGTAWSDAYARFLALP